MVQLTDPRLVQWGAEIALPTSRPLANSPHFIGGRYPCRSVAYVPRMLLEGFKAEQPSFAVLDPFMGSGTTAIEAVNFTDRIYGVEIDPYARLIATVSTNKFSQDEINEIRQCLTEVVASENEITPDVSLRPDVKNIEYWFCDQNFNDLLKLKTALFTIVRKKKYKDFLLTAFGDIIRACSKAERQSLKPYISTKYTKVPKPVFSEFERIALKYLNAIGFNQDNRSDNIVWVGQDATNFQIKDPLDLAITSPPYINAMDYTRCIKLESAWIGTGNDAIMKSVKSSQLGEDVRRHGFDEDNELMALCNTHFSELQNLDTVRYQTSMAYFLDMKRNLDCVKTALRPGGKYYLIIGNSKIRGIEVPTHLIIAEIAKSLGFVWDEYFYYRIKDHRTSIPRGNRGGKIEFEHVIGLTAR